MLSKEEILRYREMGPERRYALFLELSGWAWRSLDAGSAETVQRRWALIRRQHDEGCRILDERFRRMA